MKHFLCRQRRRKSRLQKSLSGLCLLAGALLLGTTTLASAAPQVHFGVPNWPGITVKTEVAAQLLEAMGYATKQTSASPTFAVGSMKNGQLDAYLGGWLPHEEGFLIPAIEAGELKELTTNIREPIMGLAVPKYVWDEGVHSVADLTKYADKFDKKIYGIEPGTGVNSALKDAIKNNFQNLGDWRLVESSTSGMLVQVGNAIKKKEWIAFLGWQPHWMNVKYDIKYLEAVEDNSKIAYTISNVLTVVTPELAAEQPEATRFLTQFQIEKKTQSEWILALTLDERDPVEIASTWISDNLDTVAKWLDGVNTLDGEPAFDVVQAKYAN